MRRKSPFRHHVRSHKRSTLDGNVAVHDYMRGDGVKPNISRPNLKRGSQKLANFLVRINYRSLAPDNIQVSAGSHPEAIESAMLARVTLEPPTQVEAIRQ